MSLFVSWLKAQGVNSHLPYNDVPKCQQRFSEHFGYFKADKILKPSGGHFNLPGHKLSEMEGMVLGIIRFGNPYILRARGVILIFNFGLQKEP